LPARCNVRFVLVGVVLLFVIAVALYHRHTFVHSYISVPQAICAMAGDQSCVPDFAVVGFWKTGTTTLLHLLKAHPKICLSQNIPTFWSSQAFFDRPILWRKSNSKLCSLRRNKTCQVLGFKEAGYAAHPTTIGPRLKCTNPKMKLIFLLRDPIYREFSQWWMEYCKSVLQKEGTFNGSKIRPLHVGNFEEWLDVHDWKVGAYILHIKKWLEVFPRRQLLFLRSEHFFHDIAGNFKQVEKFLGLPNYELPKSMFRTFSSSVLCSTQLNRPNMSEQTKERLHAFYDPYQEELVDLLGENFRFW